MLFHKFATELFEWVAPYSGSPDGIGLMARKEIMNTLHALIVKHNIQIGSYAVFTTSIISLCNVWVRTSNRPYTDNQKTDFIQRAARIVKRNQEPIESDFDFFS